MNKTLMAILAMLFSAVAAAAQNANLKIIVIAGEGAVNIIQQKTAVAPVVEIRDRNNLPVSGATVTFSIGGGNSAAFAGGAQTLTVTTNAAGRAAAAALNPLGGGSFEIQVSAAFQGQTAVATIAQTNVLTAAEAAAQTAAGASGGGGLSGTTIGIIGAAVGGGALAATQVGGDAPAETQAVGPAGGGGGGGATVYSGSFSGQMVVNQNSGGILCDFTKNLSGTLKITLTNSAPPGTEEITGNLTEISRTASPFCNNAGGSNPLNSQGEVTGSAAALAFSAIQSSSNTDPSMPIGTMTFGFTFAGSLSAGAITGMLTYRTTANAVSGNNPITSLGTVAMPVTLR